MKPIAILLLGYVLVGELFLKFLPIPFLGIVIALSITPLAHLISWKELLQINFISSIIQTIKASEGLVFGLSLIPLSSYFSSELILIVLIVEFTFQVVFTTVLTTILQKILYYLLPKRLRMENIKL